MITYDQTIMLSMFNICMFDNVDRVAFDYRIYQQSSYITGVDVCLTVILIAPQAMLTTLINPTHRRSFFTCREIVWLKGMLSVTRHGTTRAPPEDYQRTIKWPPEDHQMTTRGLPDARIKQ